MKATIVVTPFVTHTKPVELIGILSGELEDGNRRWRLVRMSGSGVSWTPIEQSPTFDSAKEAVAYIAHIYRLNHMTRT